MAPPNDGDNQGVAAEIKGVDATLREHHAFLLRWGTSEEIGARVVELRRIASWWASKDVPAGDDEAGSTFGAASERLASVREAVRTAETTLEQGGYEFDTHLRVLRRLRRSAVDGGEPLERAQTLLAQSIVEVFEQLKEEGRPNENTRELRIEIRARLSHSLHPGLLSDGAINAAVDENLAHDK